MNTVYTKLNFITNRGCLKSVEKKICSDFIHLHKSYSEMITFPHAKINIGLWITAKRPDGYHDIQTIFYPVGLCDALEFVLSPSGGKKDNLSVTGIALNGTAENLVIKALTIMRKKVHIPWLDIHLHKVIPPGAGLGGGSSDAAFFLKMLNKYFNAGLTDGELKVMALEAGSDSPFFIDCVPAFAQGRGEKLTPLPPVSGRYHLIIVYPGIQISTREAYMSCCPEMRETMLPVYYSEDISMWKNIIRNDFECIIFAKYPYLKEVKELLYRAGALYSSMSGSGSAVYGIFHEKPVIREALLKNVVYSGPL